MSITLDPPDANTAATVIMGILRQLRSPRAAAAAIALVRANLHVQAGADTAAKQAAMMNEDDKAAFELWESITARH
jgi:hypothetical protein